MRNNTRKSYYEIDRKYASIQLCFQHNSILYTEK